VGGEMGILLAADRADLFAAANYFMDTFSKIAFPFWLSKE